RLKSSSTKFWKPRRSENLVQPSAGAKSPQVGDLRSVRRPDQNEVLSPGHPARRAGGCLYDREPMNVVVIVTVAHHASDGEFALTPVHGEALLTHTVRGLLGVPEIDLVLVAAPQRCAQSFSEALGGLPCRVVTG